MFEMANTLYTRCELKGIAQRLHTSIIITKVDNALVYT